MLAQIKVRVSAWAISLTYWFISRFWRVRQSGGPGGPNPTEAPRIYAHWHTDELLLIYVCLFRRMAIMASRSKDGELMKLVLEAFGFRVVRGSSTRGGAAGLKGLIDVVTKEKYHASLAVDGPRGPIFKVKPGILKLAQETGLPVVVGVASASRRFVFQKAWNRCYLPYPFARCEVMYGDPITVPKDLSDVQFEEFRLLIETRLLELKTQVEAKFGRKFDPRDYGDKGVALLCADGAK